MIRQLVLLLLLFPLAACDIGESATREILARQRAIDPPDLWLVKDIDPGGRVLSANWTCADTRMRQAFARASLEVEGTTCQVLGVPTERPGFVSLKCAAGAHQYGFVTRVRGDPARNFQLTVDVTPLDGAAGGAEKTRSYRRQGPCPDSWRVGDQVAAAG
jgi:hypothetical protein